MTLDELAIAETERVLLETGLDTVGQLLKALKKSKLYPHDLDLLDKPTGQWDVYDVRHWLRLITGYESPDSRWGDEQ